MQERVSTAIGQVVTQVEGSQGTWLGQVAVRWGSWGWGLYVPANLDDGICESLHVTRREGVSSHPIDDDLRHAILCCSHARLLHRQRLEQHVGQTLLACRRQRDDVAPLEDLQVGAVRAEV